MPVGRLTLGLAASGWPNSGLYKKSGDTSTASMMAAIPLANCVATVDAGSSSAIATTSLNIVTSSSASPATRGRRYAFGTKESMNVRAQAAPLVAVTLLEQGKSAESAAGVPVTLVATASAAVLWAAASRLETGCASASFPKPLPLSS